MPYTEVRGCRIYFARSGASGKAADAAAARAGSGYPLLLIHGAGGSHLSWGFQLSALGANATVAAPDLPGHGRSDPPGRESIEEYRDLIVGFIDALGMDRAIIAGHSMGGAIALSLALAAPERVVALILVDTGARLRVAPAILDGILADPEATAALVVENSYAPDLDPGLRRRCMDEFLACPAAVTRADFGACDVFDVRSRLGEIGVPTLILCGSEDRMTPPKHSQFLVEGISGARYVEVGGAGHSSMLERPEPVNEAISAFLKSLA